MGRPRILLDVRFFHNAKVVSLANRQKLGLIWVLCEAKQQDIPGVFGSIAALKLTAGPFRDCVQPLLEGGLLHEAAAMCARCRARFGEVKPNAIVVHDWQDHQESRTTQWRAEVGLRSGHERLGNGAGETVGETPGKQAGNAHAREGASASLSTSSSGSNGSSALDGDLASVLQWLAQQKVWVAEASRTHIDLSVLVDQHGAQRVIETMAGLPQPLHDGPQYVYGARKRLNRIPEPEARTKAKGDHGDEGASIGAFKSA